MASTKISALTALTGATVATDDELAIVDTSATATKRITFSELQVALNSGANAGLGGVTDDSTAVQAAIDAAEAAGGIVYFPSGTYRIVTALTLDLTGFSDDGDVDGVGILGAGNNNTELYWDGVSAGACLTISGGTTGEQYHAHAMVRGFKFTPATARRAGDIALKLDTLAYAYFDDLFFRSFDTGTDITDCVSMNFENCHWRWCSYGITGNPQVSIAPPNNINFFGCELANAYEYGASFEDCANISFIGGAIEGNGVNGSDTNRYGVRILTPGPGGSVGATFRDVYFEANATKCDIWVDAGSNDFAVSIDGCNFNRITGTAGQFVTNNILISRDSGDGDVVMNVSGCGFAGYNTYSASASRMYIALSGTGTDDVVVRAKGCQWGSATERPDDVVGTWRSVWVPAKDWIPLTTSGAPYSVYEYATNDLNVGQLLFDSSVAEGASVTMRPPLGWAGNDVKARIFWDAVSGSGGVVWRINLIPKGDSDAWDSATGAGGFTEVTDTLLTVGDLHITDAFSLTAPTGGGLGVPDLVYASLTRRPADAADTIADDVRFQGAEFQFFVSDVEEGPWA
jgi:hypothetical protein